MNKQIKNNQKQPSRGVPRKRGSANLQDNTMPKCDFNKVSLPLY